MWSTFAVSLLAAGSVLSISIQEPLLAAGDPPNIPPFPFPRPKPVTHTVYDLIRHNEKYTKLNKAIKFVGDDFISVLNNTSQEITFFAVPDSALRPPHHDDEDDDHKHRHKHHHHGKHNALLDITIGDLTLEDTVLKTSLLGRSTELSEAIELIELIESVPRGLDEDEDPGHERRKEMFRQIVKAILNYHVLPSGGFNLASLAHNSTWATNFMIPKLSGGRGQRILVTEHVEEVEADKKKKKKKAKEDVVTRINLYAKVDEADTKTENGYVHVLNHPLLPPPAIFQEVFLAQHYFSTFTSALQRVGLADELDIRYVKGEGDEHGHLEGSTAVTVFAPSNAAFDRLPMKLKLFLFSNFGRRVLKKLLEYHIVPNVVAHADYIFEQKADTDTFTTLKRGHSSDEPISSVKESFNTRLFNHTIDFSAEKTERKHKHRKEFKNEVFVNGHPVAMADLVAVNGAFHVIDHLLCPCKKHKHDSVIDEAAANEWDDWETCVAQLAN